MTPQHKNSPPGRAQQTLEASAHEKSKRMKTMLQRRKTAQTVISRALSKPRALNRAGTQAERCHWPSSQPESLMIHDSVFIMEGHVNLTNGLQTQERHLFLFSDILIIAKSKLSASLKLKAQVKLSEMWLSTCVERVTERKLGSKNCFVIGWPTVNYVITLSSTEAKDKWFTTLKWYITQSKQNEHPSKIVMTVTVLDDSMRSATIQLQRGTTAEDLIQSMAAQHHLKGPPMDYQLWVETAAEESPFLLIGHEIPYSIVLHHLRVSGCLAMVRQGLLTAEGSLHLDLLPRGIPPAPLFCLRARTHANMVHYPNTDFTQKLRRKRSLIDWALRRGPSSHSVSSTNTADFPCLTLFGQPLSAICPQGNPPQPIMDMLCMLYQEGPSIQGIFRRSASTKSCRELKERLNAGLGYLPLGESVLVVAAILTDFLRSLPDCILGSQMRERWLEAIELGNQEQRNAAISSLVAELPAANITLLRYLFRVLHHIHQSAETNQMTASNLALCIAPNMLTLPMPLSPAQEDTRTMKKVAKLIEHLIEDTPVIFGVDDGALLRDWRNVKDEQKDDDIEANSPNNWPLNTATPDPTDVPPPSPHPPLHLSLASLVLREEGRDCGFTALSSSSSSVCSLHTCLNHLNSSQGRCVSEPSVCPEPPHNPVARQSSCDATISGNSGLGHAGQCQSPRIWPHHYHPQAKQRTSLAMSDLSPRISVKGHHALWRSPQVSPRFQHPTRRLPSLSSLSSTGTSSLSSLDSTMSLTSSSELLPGPREGSSCPFLFGTAAMLRPLTPDVPRKFPPNWSMTLSQEQRYGEEEEEQEGEGDWEEGEMKEWSKQVERVETNESPCQEKVQMSDKQMGMCASGPPGVGTQQICDWGSESKCGEPPMLPQISGRIRKTSIKRIQLRGPESEQLNTTFSSAGGFDLPETEGVQRTKLTFYSSAAILTIKEHTVGMATPAACISPPVSTKASDSMSHRVQVHIPQAVFYGQNTPLVLHSVSTKVAAPLSSGTICYPKSTTIAVREPGRLNPQHKPVTSGNAYQGCSMIAELPKARKDAIQVTCTTAITHEDEYVHRNPNSSTSLPNPSNSPRLLQAAAAGIRHSIRIRLPAAVRNTVREYFGQSTAMDGVGVGGGTNPTPGGDPPVALENQPLINTQCQQRKGPAAAQLASPSTEEPLT